ncbi:transcription/translation regulatory transformer protein RfaH [Pseudoalteromonas sp. T1lg65]|uniref:transcription/translation regulatory transformer protein RfaH n=1 Tax=Pseudoalteromonas sp. T1lg65 TaxID=2077101 RepID=UPI003F78DFEF
MERWYLVYCKPKQEQRAQQNLQQQGITACFPTMFARKTASSPVKPVPLFPRYLFVRLDPHSGHFSAVKNTRGISDFIRYGTQLQLVPEEIVHHFMQQESATEQTEFNQGDVVVLNDACYRDIDAIYQQPDGEFRSILLINMLNKSVSIVVDNQSIKRKE